MRDWSILIFTILFATAVGLTGFAALSGVLLQGELDAARQYAVMLNPMLMACVLGVVGFAASFRHLGYPFNAPHVMRGVASSALSREIAMACAFVAADHGILTHSEVAGGDVVIGVAQTRRNDADQDLPLPRTLEIDLDGFVLTGGGE